MKLLNTEKKITINTNNVDRMITETIIPTTATLASAYLEWAKDREYDALGAYYLVGMALLNKEFKASELEGKGNSKANLSKMRKIAKAVTENKDYATLWTSGAIHSFADAYDMACDMTGKVATSRTVYLEDLQKKEQELLKQLAEIREAKKTAPRKPKAKK